jgi:hypothetical protein
MPAGKSNTHCQSRLAYRAALGRVRRKVMS